MSERLNEIVEQWHRERPDLDVSPMSVIGRLSRAARQVEAELAPVFAGFDLDSGSFDVLATLRRSGAPFRLSPRELTRTAMITSSATAQRLNRLEARGLVSRSKSSEDGRGIQVTLTESGQELIDRVLPQHVTNEHRVLAALTAEERESLAALLERLSSSLGGDASS